MASISIRQFTTDIPYTLALVYRPTEQVYAVTFTPQKAGVTKHEEKTFPLFEDAWNNYSRNVYVYTGKKIPVMTEEQFWGLPEGSLFPKEAKNVR